MLFRMGQCLQTRFKQLGEAEGYYRRSEGLPLHRRSLEKDDHWTRSVAGFAYAHSNLEGSAGSSTAGTSPARVWPARGGGGPLPGGHRLGAGVIRLAPEWEFPCAKKFLDTSSNFSLSNRMCL